ncbi:MAG TPA: hypothetical protein ENN53_04030 [Candidatus Acetothermia bacterium]|nr:hypothetical protein [Candidatus Acetothermia bacterium]
MSNHREAILVGLKEGGLLAAVLAAALLPVSWRWSLGVVGGVAAVAIGRLVWGQLLAILVRDRGGRVAASAASFIRQVLVGGLAVGGIGVGLPPLAVAGGLLLAALGRVVGTVNLARTSR